MSKSDDEIPQEIAEKILKLKAQFYSKGSIVRAIRKESGSKEKAKEYVDVMYSVEKIFEKANPEIVKDKSNNEIKTGLGALFTGILLAILGPLGFALTLFGIIYLAIGLYHKFKYKKLTRESERQ